MKIDSNYDLIIIGSGPAGMSAAIEASKHELSILLLDDQFSAGGQVYRNIAGNQIRKCTASFLGRDYWSGSKLADEFENIQIDVITQSRVWQISKDKRVYFNCKTKAFCAQAKFVIIATGAMERPMPVPGWTLPGVMTVGAAQTLLKNGSMGAEDAVFAGTGPLFYLTIWQYLKAGFRVKAVIDTAPSKLPFYSFLWAIPALLQIRLLVKGLQWRSFIQKNTAYFKNARSVSFTGVNKADIIHFVDNTGTKKSIDGEHFFIHQGVIPNINLSMATEIEHLWSDRQKCWYPYTDKFGESSTRGIFVVGDGAGIFGVQVAALSGRIAAKRIANYGSGISMISTISSLVKRGIQKSARPFLDHVFAPTREWLVPVHDNVIVCRCEALNKAEITEAINLGVSGPNQLKSFSRAGMGRCQGRLCGLTVQHMIAEQNKMAEKDVGYYRLRPPIRPITVGELAALTEHDNIL